MTVSFQHGTKPTYNPNLPSTLVISLCSLAKKRKCNLDELALMFAELDKVLSPEGNRESFDCAHWAERVVATHHIGHYKTKYVDFVHAILSQALYGYNKYGTKLQPNAPDQENKLDFYAESLLEMADLYEYSINCKYEGRDEEVAHLIGLLGALQEVLRATKVYTKIENGELK